MPIGEGPASRNSTYWVIAASQCRARRPGGAGASTGRPLWEIRWILATRANLQDAPGASIPCHRVGTNPSLTRLLGRRDSDEVMSEAATTAPGLAWLLHPIAPSEFLRSYWETQPLAVRRAEPTYFSTLPGIDDVDGLITTGVFGGGRWTPGGRLVRTRSDGKRSERPFRLEADGRADIHDIYRSYDAGYTVVLDGIHWRSPAVGALCRGLEADLQHPVGANLYLTPHNAQGFRPHVDSHDVIIAQLHGAKEWRVGAVASRAFPTVSNPGGPVDRVPDAQVYLVSQGDALYIPRGYAHEALTQESSSLHLTIGMNAFTWADLLAEALRLVVAEAPDLRRALPVDHLGRSFEESELTSLVERVEAVGNASVLEAARLSLGSRLLQRQAATTGHFGSLDAGSGVTAASILTRGFQGPYRIRSDDERVIVDYPGNYLSVPQLLAPALEYAANTPTFAVGSIPGDLSDADRIEFARRLVSEGFLSVVNYRRDVP